MTQSHYSLRWNNHQTHILAAFDALLQAETLVDVTLVCAETSVRAHKVVLSACSPFFQRIFSENPCKHPVIVLKDFNGWEVQAIVDFMYKGEISVIQEQLQSLIKAAESLQVRGLANQDPFIGVDKESTSIINQTPTPSASPNDYDRHYFQPASRYPTPGVTVRTPAGGGGVGDPTSPFSPIPNNYENSTIKLPHMSHLSFPDTLLPTRQDCQSPSLPRRKQARPRRRSGEMCGPQDLSTDRSKQSSLIQQPPPPQESPSQQQQQQQQPNTVCSTTPLLPPPVEETAENLCIKKPKEERQLIKEEEMKLCRTPEPSLASAGSPELDLSMQSVKDYLGRSSSSPVNVQQHQPTLNMKQEIDSHSPLPFPPMPSVSALAMTPPHSKFFGLDSPLGLFPPGLDGCRNPLFDLPDPRTTADSQLFVKKKMGRPKGQHSAPRGGPPRSWTNAELTEALQHVWNKKMTTSQASRIFGIPYNSLLMYVRGKYGKSLKLEQLRKDCIAGPNPPMDLLSMAGGNNNNNSCKTDSRGDLVMDPMQPNTRPPSTEDQPPQPPPIFNPFAPHNFYPDFGTGFPIPVSMIHLLPQSEKNRDHYGGPQPPSNDDDCSSNKVKEIDDEQQELFRPPTLSVDDRRELVQQNGQD